MEYSSSQNATTYSRYEWPVSKDALYTKLCLAVQTNVNVIYFFFIIQN